MRPLLALVIILLATGTTVPWWSGSRQPPAGAPRIAVGGIVTLDPTQASTLEEFRVLAALYEGLTRIDPATLAPVAALAERWSCSDDGLEWTFTLGQRTWSDGTPVTAQQMAEGFAVHRRGSASGALLSGIAGVEPTGDTLRIVTTAPMPWLPKILATPVFIPWHPSQALPQAWADPLSLIGNGPLRCVASAPRRHLDLAPAPTYAGPVPARGPLRLLVVDDAGTAVRLYLDGQVDAVLRLNSDTIGDLVRSGSPDLQRTSSWGTELYRLRMAGPGGPIPREVRQSLARSIDRTAIVNDLLRGNGIPATTLVPASAAALGYPLPTPATNLPALVTWGPAIELVVPSNQPERLRIAEWLCDRWKRDLGITVTLTAIPSNQAQSRAKALDYDLARGSIVGDYLDPSYFLDCFRGGSGMNRTGWSDAAYEALLDQAAREPTRRMELLATAERRLLDEAVVIPLYHYACTFLVQPRVAGIHANTLELVRYADVGWK